MYFMMINKFNPNVNPDEIGKIIPLHILWIKERIASGDIVQAGKWGSSGGMAILMAKDISEAKMISISDPLIKSGFVTFELEQFYPDVAIK